MFNILFLILLGAGIQKNGLLFVPSIVKQYPGYAALASYATSYLTANGFEKLYNQKKMSDTECSDAISIASVASMASVFGYVANNGALNFFGCGLSAANLCYLMYKQYMESSKLPQVSLKKA